MAIVDEVDGLAEAHDRAGRFGPEYIASVRDAGLLDGVDLAKGEFLGEHLKTLSSLARGCPSTAFVVHMHHVARTFLTAIAEKDQNSYLAEILDQPQKPLFCSLNSEPGMHYRRRATRSSSITWVTPNAESASVVARKHFCSGVSYADFAFSLIGSEHAVCVPLRLRGVSIGDPIEFLGLRAADSRTVEFDVDLPARYVTVLQSPLPVHLWSLGYAAILHGIGDRVVDELKSSQGRFEESGRWGEHEQIRLGAMVELRESSRISIDAASRWTRQEDLTVVTVAKRRATEFATRSTRSAMEIVGGESALLHSIWCRLFRDASTLALIPPSRDRAWQLLSSDTVTGLLPT